MKPVKNLFSYRDHQDDTCFQFLKISLFVLGCRGLALRPFVCWAGTVIYCSLSSAFNAQVLSRVTVVGLHGKLTIFRTCQCMTVWKHSP